MFVSGIVSGIVSGLSIWSCSNIKVRQRKDFSVKIKPKFGHLDLVM